MTSDEIAAQLEALDEELALLARLAEEDEQTTAVAADLVAAGLL